MNAVATKPAVRPALQARSRRTLNALLDALDSLLRDRPFESITVLELVQAAKVSTGAFYARFASKEDLLPELYSRFQQELAEHSESELDPTAWAPLSEDERLDRFARSICETYGRRAWLLRAMVLHSRRHYSSDPIPDAASSGQMKWLNKLTACVGADPSPWPGVTSDRLEFALYIAVTLTREAVLFPNLPMATALGVNETSMRRRVPEIVRGQLGLHGRKGTTP